MIKKISAVVLALVLCLSVIVVPTSALDLGDASVAFELKWDKEYYSAGETAYLQVFMKADENLELSTGNIIIGTNSAQITQEYKHTDATASDLWLSFWKAPSSGGWQNTTTVNKIIAQNTEAENALYDQYLKVVIARDTQSGLSHENASTLSNGLPASEINELADAGEPIITFKLKVADNVADGTKLVAGIPSGVLKTSPNQVSFKYIKTPGTANTTASVAAADIDLSQAVAEATVGTPAPTYPEFTINQGKDAIRFNKNADNSYKDISIRTTAEIAIADLQDACDGKTANDDIEKYITEAGFVYIPTTYEFSVDAAKAAINTIKDDLGESNNYTKKKVSYIQKTDTSYKYICVVDVKDEAIASAAFNTFAYICLDFDGNGEADQTYYYAAENSVSAKTLYNAKYGQANSTYGWTLAAK